MVYGILPSLAATRVRGKYWDKQGLVELLELAVILLFWFFDTPSRVYAQASATPACSNTSPYP